MCFHPSSLPAPKQAPVSACAQLKLCSTLPGNQTGDVEILDFYAGIDKDPNVYAINPGRCEINYAFISRACSGIVMGCSVLPMHGFYGGGRSSPSVLSRSGSLLLSVPAYVRCTGDVISRSEGEAVDIVISYASKTGCNSGKIVLEVAHESGFRATWGVKMLDASPRAYSVEKYSWDVDTSVVPTEANSKASESNFTEWIRCDGQCLATLAHPSNRESAGGH